MRTHPFTNGRSCRCSFCCHNISKDTKEFVQTAPLPLSSFLPSTYYEGTCLHIQVSSLYKYVNTSETQGGIERIKLLKKSTHRCWAVACHSTFPIKLSVAYYSCLTDTDMFPRWGQTNRAHMGSDISSCGANQSESRFNEEFPFVSFSDSCPASGGASGGTMLTAFYHGNMIIKENSPSLLYLLNKRKRLLTLTKKDRNLKKGGRLGWICSCGRCAVHAGVTLCRRFKQREKPWRKSRL